MKLTKGLRNFILAMGLLFSACCQAGVYWGAGGYYGGGYYGRGYYHGHPGCCGNGWGWGPPNVIINVPTAPPPAYVVECETVEVCDNYTDECWQERRCN
jgi:hypothetical protein